MHACEGVELPTTPTHRLLLLTLIFTSVLASPSPSTVSTTNSICRESSSPSSLVKLWRQQEDAWKTGWLKRRNELFGGGDRRRYLPPKGAVYVGTINLPILGMQTFMMTIVSRSVVRITLTGAMNLDEEAAYRDERIAETPVVRLLMSFNEPTRQLLGRYKTTIRSTLYYAEGDYGVLVISPLILPAIRVRMERRR